ncbi:MAG: hypothetical protein R3E84_03510 [Pseudomonadales bacterium]
MPYDYSVPVRLIPVEIPKPWGRERWYTGMEARGESQVHLPGGLEIPLSLYLNANPHAASGGEDVLLLKILDPDPEPVLGDLYFEVHEEKREVYVVTHVDASAWPEGIGGIRFGMAQSVRAQYSSDADFRAAYLTAVKDYEVVRRAIDDGFEDEVLTASERELRAAMERFTHLRPLRVGDVVHVPAWLPHSLLHGVRVVEFQTPTYERLIVSFAQRVLTQHHWDTENAVAHMALGAGEEQPGEAVAPGIDRIARFDHFNVWRATPQAGRVSLPTTLPYAVVMPTGNRARVGKLILAPEEAAFIPHAALPDCTLVADAEDAFLLIAAPTL